MIKWAQTTKYTETEMWDYWNNKKDKRTGVSSSPQLQVTPETNFPASELLKIESGRPCTQKIKLTSKLYLFSIPSMKKWSQSSLQSGIPWTYPNLIKLPCSQNTLFHWLLVQRLSMTQVYSLSKRKISLLVGMLTKQSATLWNTKAYPKANR